MDALKKAERYAMIRRAALKIQQRQLNQRRAHTLIQKYEKALDKLDDQSSMHWSDTDRYLDSHYGDRVKGEKYDGY